MNAAAANAGAFNFGVTTINPSSGSTLITGGTGTGNIYSFNAALTLTLTSTAAPTVGTFNTVIFSLKTLGTALDYGNVVLTLAFSLGAGAVLSPGNRVGTLTTAGETWAGGGSYLWEVSAAGQDLVSIGGGPSLSANASNRFALGLRTRTVTGGAGGLDGFNPAQSYTWRLATTTGGISGFDPADFQIDKSGFANAGGTFSVSQIGNDLYLNYAAVPEPSTWWLVGGGVVEICTLRRRRAR